MKAERRPPWTAIVAGIVPPLYCFVVAGMLISMGEVQDFGDMGAVGWPLVVIGFVELLLSSGIWLGSRAMWFVTVIAHVLVLPVMLLGQNVQLGVVWAYAACMVVPAVLAMPFLLLPQSRRWCGIG